MKDHRLGMVVAIVRTDTNKVLATAEIDNINDKEIRTNTPYEQLSASREVSRRYWRATPPHQEMRIPREEKTTRPPCFIRPATNEDVAVVRHRVEVRRARERMPRSLRYKAEYERQIELTREQLKRLTREQLKRQMEPYETLLEQIKKDELLIASGDE